MGDITNAELAILAQQDMNTLAEWWCELNCFGWPAELGENDETSEQFMARRRLGLPTSVKRRAIMDWIGDAIGHRAVSRVWNKDMSEEEFNDFWRGNYEGHKPSRERYWRRVADRCKA